ncbi:hypothetical protein DFJ73DRAFT_648834, partial [Zopfochytrium polystomum]
MNAAHKALLPYCPFLARPARKQAEELADSRQKEQPAGTVYNIWYNKWAGGDRYNPNTTERAETRCNIARDAGYTRATRSSSFCIHFARGCCARGSECNFWHRIPLDVDRVPMAQDVFGRDRFRDEREDMGGVGSFEKDNRTLYLGQLGLAGGLEDVLYKHFIEWGEIEYIRLLTGKGVAFVRYKTRISAEFAKEAMHCQAMDNNEILNVRWATEDPNPRASAISKRKAEEQVMEAMKGSLPIIGDRGTIMDYQAYYQTDAAGNPLVAGAAAAASAKRLQLEGAVGSAPPSGKAQGGPAGWDTAHGFFYASNEQAALVSADALDQAGPQQPVLYSTGWDVEALEQAGNSGASLDAATRVYKQRADGAEYALGVGKSRWYTGVGQPMEQSRKKMEEDARRKEDEAKAAAELVRRALESGEDLSVEAVAAAGAAAAAAKAKGGVLAADAESGGGGTER